MSRVVYVSSEPDASVVRTASRLDFADERVVEVRSIANRRAAVR